MSVKSAYSRVNTTTFPRKSFKHFTLSQLHPPTWLKNESTPRSETSRRFGPATLPFLSFGHPESGTEKRYCLRERTRGPLRA